MKSCSNCVNRCFISWHGEIDYCLGFEMSNTYEDCVRNAENCTRYKLGTPSCLEEDRYTESATNHDYSPSSPWNAPGMSIKDFI